MGTTLLRAKPGLLGTSNATKLKNLGVFNCMFEKHHSTSVYTRRQSCAHAPSSHMAKALIGV